MDVHHFPPPWHHGDSGGGPQGPDGPPSMFCSEEPGAASEEEGLQDSEGGDFIGAPEGIEDVASVPPKGTRTVWGDGYFFLTNYMDAKYQNLTMWVRPKWAKIGELGSHNPTKTLAVGDIDGDRFHKEPVMTVLALKSWMLWRASFDNWHLRHPARQQWYIRQLDIVKRDCTDECLPEAARDAIMEWTPQVLSG